MIKTDYLLNDHTYIPSIGFGTWQIPDGDQAYASTLAALKAGYRHIDTAYVYRNEQSVGQAIKDSGIDRRDLYITTKLSANIKDPEAVVPYFEKSLKNLGLEYIDLYLIHNARPWSDRIENYDYFQENVAVWKQMEELLKTGKCRSIGVSNFYVKDLENLLKHTEVVPVLNQIKYHPGYVLQDTIDYCQQHNILIEAYSPFGTGKIFDSEILKTIAQEVNKSIAQVSMRWLLQKGALPLPKSVTPERIVSNLDVFDFHLTENQMELLDQHPEFD